MLLNFILLHMKLLLMCVTIQQTTIDGNTLEHTNWGNSIKATPPSTGTLFNKWTTQNRNNKHIKLNGFSEAQTTAPSVPLSRGNALKNLTQLIQYLRHQHDYTKDVEELEDVTDNYYNSDSILNILNAMKRLYDNMTQYLTADIVTILSDKHIEMNGTVKELFAGVNEIKNFCDIFRMLSAPQKDNGNTFLHKNFNKEDYIANAKWILVQPRNILETTAENNIKYNKRNKRTRRRISAEPSTAALAKNKHKKSKLSSSSTSLISSLLAPLSAPVIAASSMLTFQEDEGRRKHKKVKRKFKKFLLPLLLAYKLKFLTLIPLLLGGLVLLVGTTGMAGFFFALFAAVMSLRASRALVHTTSITSKV